MASSATAINAPPIPMALAPDPTGLKEEGIYPKRVLEFGTIEAIIGCVKAGMGIAVMVKSILKDHEQSLTLTSLSRKYSKVPTYFIMRKDVLFSAALQRFVEMIK